MANTMNNTPPMMPMTFSDRYLARTAPPDTAIPVATAWAAIAPAATLKGFCAAERAMVDRKDRSPNSAAKTKPKMLRMRALFVYCIGLCDVVCVLCDCFGFKSLMREWVVLFFFVRSF